MNISRRGLGRALAAGLLTPVLGLYGFKARLKQDSFNFAAVGDFGTDRGGNAAIVADLIKSWNPDHIITLGDNSYRRTPTDNIDWNVGALYQEYIHPYKGKFGTGSPDGINRFWPSLGNHDLDDDGLTEYLDYFTLPNNGRYYDLQIGPVHLFCISTSDEPDGVTSSSIQAKWLKERLNDSDAPWKLVYGHRAPHSSGRNGGSSFMRWPYAEWGASAVISGHVHNYERLLVDGIPYLVNGLGGNQIYQTVKPNPNSLFRYSAMHGAMRISGNSKRIVFEFINIQNQIADRYELVQPGFWTTINNV